MNRRIIIAFILSLLIVVTGCSGQASQSASATPVPKASNTPAPTATTVPAATNTVQSTSTNTAIPSATTQPSATNTKTPKPTKTPTLQPTATVPPATPTPQPTDTLQPSATAAPTNTKTPRPTKTPTLQPTATETPTPQPTDTPQPSATLAPTLTKTPRPTKTATLTSTPTVAASATSAAAATLTPTVVIPAATATTTTSTGLSWVNVYFTNPNPPDQVGKGIDNFVVPVLAAAQKSIDVTSFDFTLPSVTNALVDAAKRGVVVRVVLDEVNGVHVLKASEAPTGQDFDALKALQDAGIPVINGGRSTGLMHNKIIIVDGKILFMGSWNMSYNDTFRNNNNLLQITDPQLIANYQAKFNELFVNQKFGAKAVVGALTPKLTLDGVVVENYFSPVDKVSDKLVSYINGATKSVKFMIFTFTDKNVASAMIDASKRGLDVQGVIENRGASQGSLVSLFCAQVPVKVDGNKYTMHHKVIIIDESTVITGSFNVTDTANKYNDDNILVIHSPLIAAQYEAEYARVSGLGKTPDAAAITCPAS